MAFVHPTQPQVNATIDRVRELQPGKRVAATAAYFDRHWGLAFCVEGEPGYFPCPWGSWTEQPAAQRFADAVNREDLKLTQERDVAIIVLSTMRPR